MGESEEEKGEGTGCGVMGARETAAGVGRQERVGMGKGAVFVGGESRARGGERRCE
jgi:hypothetical protein